MSKDGLFTLSKDGRFGYAAHTDDTLSFLESKTLSDGSDQAKEDTCDIRKEMAKVTKIAAGDGYSVGITSDKKVITFRPMWDGDDAKLSFSLVRFKNCHKIVAVVAEKCHCFVLCEVSEGEKVEAAKEAEEKMSPATGP